MANIDEVRLVDEIEGTSQDYGLSITASQDDIERLKNLIPKGTATGEEITINDSVNYKFNKFGIKGNTEQDSYTGKNLFNGNEVSTTHTSNWGINFINNILTIEHKNTYTTGAPTLDLGKLPNGTYILNGKLGDKISLYKNGTYFSLLQNESTFTCDGTENISLVFANPDNTTLVYENLMLSTNGGDYEPYVRRTSKSLSIISTKSKDSYWR